MNLYRDDKFNETVEGSGQHFNMITFDGTAELAKYLRDKRVIDSRNGNWHLNGLTQKQVVEFIEFGNDAAVAKSDEMLAEMESHMDELATTYKVVGDVAGGVPNVAAFLAGDPINMRRRKRVLSPLAPLTFYIDLTSSGGIPDYTLRRRGAAILALVRILETRRPVTVYCGVALGRGYDTAASAWVRLDTMPLDLTRAAHMLSHTSVSRAALYGSVEAMMGKHYGQWPWDNINKWYRMAAQCIKTITGNDEVVFVAPAYRDLAEVAMILDEPVKWIEMMLKKYGGAVEEE